MTAQKIEGVVPILLTPFDAKGRIDEDSMGRQVDFTIGAGVHGLGLALGSEIFKFTEAERARLVQVTVEAVKGRVPLVVNTGAAATDLAVFYSRAAQAAGADALMIIPPSFMPAGPDEIAAYYRQISDAVTIPIVMQDVPQAPISAALALRIANDSAQVQYIKVENLPVTPRVADMAAQAGHQLTIFGGAGGSYFIEEMRRGARGTMPFPSQSAEFVRVWTLFQSGDHAAAQRAFDSSIMAINRLAAQSGDIFYHVHKQIMQRRGIFTTSLVRQPTTFVDSITQYEIDGLIDHLLAA